MSKQNNHTHTEINQLFINYINYKRYKDFNIFYFYFRNINKERFYRFSKSFKDYNSYDDILHTVFLKLLTNLESIKSGKHTNVLAYATTILINLMKDISKKASNQREEYFNPKPHNLYEETNKINGITIYNQFIKK